jgi:hypothetical protein
MVQDAQGVRGDARFEAEEGFPIDVGLVRSSFCSFGGEKDEPAAPYKEKA